MISRDRESEKLRTLILSSKRSKGRTLALTRMMRVLDPGEMVLGQKRSRNGTGDNVIAF